MNTCQSCKHYRPEESFLDDRAHTYALCAAPKIGAPRNETFVMMERIGGPITSRILGVCGNAGRWHEAREEE